jgi:hypothetical protein
MSVIKDTCIMNRFFKSGLVVGAAAFTFATAAYAAVTFDASTGTGFVGKGDVQLALGLNNKGLQDAVKAGSLGFTYSSEVVTEVSWVCTNTKNENTQERERTTTTSVSGVVSGVARDGKNQFTGFNLGGYSGTPTVSTPQTEGPVLNSCPTNWTLTTPAGAPELVSSTGGLYVNGVLLPITPVEPVVTP